MDSIGQKYRSLSGRRLIVFFSECMTVVHIRIDYGNCMNNKRSGMVHGITMGRILDFAPTRLLITAL